jgi:hypothetical protein
MGNIRPRAWFRGAGFGFAAIGLILAGTAQAACIDEPVLAAARLHEFETMMMDVSLRCNRIGVAMQGHFNAMVGVHHAQLDQASQRLQRFFARDAVADAQHGGLYDRYATLIANRYGAGNTSLDTCRVFDALADEVSRAGDGGRVLGAVALAMIGHPLLESATCPAKP